MLRNFKPYPRIPSPVLRFTFLAPFVFAAPLALGACSGMQLPRSLSDLDLNKAAQAASELRGAWNIPYESERALGREAAANILAKYGLCDAPSVTRYVNLVGWTLARKAGRREIEWRFGVLDSMDLNAYAAPGGYIFISKGLLAVLEDEAELAGVLSHEIQHVDRKHALTALRRSNLIRLGTKRLLDKDNLDIASKFVIGLMERGFDKGDELDADKHGVMLLARVGYDPTGLPRSLQRTQAQSKSERARPFADRHPSFQDRMKELAGLRSDLPDSGAVLRSRFLGSAAL